MAVNAGNVVVTLCDDNDKDDGETNNDDEVMNQLTTKIYYY